MERKIFFGFGNNIDYEITLNCNVLKRLSIEYDISDYELNTEIRIKDMRSFIISILSFMKTGKGSERYVEQKELIDEFSTKFEYIASMGGTPIRAAIALKKIGYSGFVLHYTTINDYVRQLTPLDCNYVCSSKEEHLFPHLIIQYNTGDRVETEKLHVIVNKPNRLIYHSDSDAINTFLTTEFFEGIEKANVLGIAGFNPIRDKKVLQNRMEFLKENLSKISNSCLVYYEDAGFYDNSFRKEISNYIGNRIDIHGMNEDELQIVAGRNIDILDVDDVISALKDVSNYFSEANILVHSSKWALLYGKDCKKYGSNLKTGIQLATTRLIHGDLYNRSDFIKTGNLPQREDSLKFKEKIEKLQSDNIVCEPAYIAPEENITTIGLGDAFVGGFLANISK